VLGLRENAQAEARHYTLMASTMGNMVIGYAMEVNAPFDALRDVRPDRRALRNTATAMVVNNKTPSEFVRESSTMPRRGRASSRLVSTGTAALDYLAVELFMRATGTSMVHVPYRGGPPR